MSVYAEAREKKVRRRAVSKRRGITIIVENVQQRRMRNGRTGLSSKPGIVKKMIRSAVIKMKIIVRMLKKEVSILLPNLSKVLTYFLSTTSIQNNPRIVV